MFKKILDAVIFLVCTNLCGQTFDLQKDQSALDYEKTRARVIEKFKNVKPGKFGEFVPGMKTKIITTKKIIALTFDACGGPTGSEVDTELMEFLKKEKIQATLFVSGPWIEKNDSLFRQLCLEPLFEIENHGFEHCLCSVITNSKYGIGGTGSVSAAFDEIDINAKKIELYSRKTPKFFRPAAVAADQACVAIANELKEKIISYDVLSGDAVPGTPADAIKKNILKKVKPGSIVIMHMNHPERNGFEALTEVIPELRKQGYEFVKLEGRSLSGKK